MVPHGNGILAVAEELQPEQVEVYLCHQLQPEYILILSELKELVILQFAGASM
jgi:hypothetical protein